jgi:hypothetical protein
MNGDMTLMWIACMLREMGSGVLLTWQHSFVNNIIYESMLFC